MGFVFLVSQKENNQVVHVVDNPQLTITQLNVSHVSCCTTQATKKEKKTLVVATDERHQQNHGPKHTTFTQDTRIRFAPTNKTLLCELKVHYLGGNSSTSKSECEYPLVAGWSIHTTQRAIEEMTQPRELDVW
jgi:hypothetical protein